MTKLRYQLLCGLCLSVLALGGVACDDDDDDDTAGESGSGAGAGGSSSGESGSGASGASGAGEEDAGTAGSGAAATHLEIINAPTDAEKVEVDPVLPLLNADGSLPPLP